MELAQRIRAIRLGDSWSEHDTESWAREHNVFADDPVEVHTRTVEAGNRVREMMADETMMSDAGL